MAKRFAIALETASGMRLYLHTDHDKMPRLTWSKRPTLVWPDVVSADNAMCAAFSQAERVLYGMYVANLEYSEPSACRNYQEMGCDTGPDGESVDPKSCYVCGMYKKDHRNG